MAAMKCIVFVVIVLSVFLIEGGAGGSKARIENEKARGRRARKILASAEEVIEAVSKLTNDSSSSEGKPVKDLLAEAKNVHKKLRKSMKSIGKFLKQRPMVGMLKVIKTLSETVGNASSTNAVLDLLIGWSGPLSREGSCVSMTTSMLSDLEGKSVLVVKQLKTEGVTKDNAEKLTETLSAVWYTNKALKKCLRKADNYVKNEMKSVNGKKSEMSKRGWNPSINLGRGFSLGFNGLNYRSRNGRFSANLKPTFSGGGVGARIGFTWKF